MFAVFIKILTTVSYVLLFGLNYVTRMQLNYSVHFMPVIVSRIKNLIVVTNIQTCMAAALYY